MLGGRCGGLREGAQGWLHLFGRAMPCGVVYFVVGWRPGGGCVAGGFGVQDAALHARACCHRSWVRGQDDDELTARMQCSWQARRMRQRRLIRRQCNAMRVAARVIGRRRVGTWGWRQMAGHTATQAAARATSTHTPHPAAAAATEPCISPAAPPPAAPLAPACMQVGSCRPAPHAPPRHAAPHQTPPPPAACAGTGRAQT